MSPGSAHQRVDGRYDEFLLLVELTRHGTRWRAYVLLPNRDPFWQHLLQCGPQPCLVLFIGWGKWRSVAVVRRCLKQQGIELVGRSSAHQLICIVGKAADLHVMPLLRHDVQAAVAAATPDA